MLELMVMGGDVKASTLYKLTKLTASGTPPANWYPYEHPLILDRKLDKAVAMEYSAGNLIPFNLATNTWEAATAGGGFPLRKGTRFTETAPSGAAYLKWGIQGGTYQKYALFYSNVKFYSESVSTNFMSNFMQCSIGNLVYLFGGMYGYSVAGDNTLGVYFYNVASASSYKTHGTVNPNAFTLRYDSCVGTDGVDIYVFGGTLATSTSSTNTYQILKYTVATKIWSTVATASPYPTNGGANVPYYNGKFYFLGNQAPPAGQLDNKKLITYTPATGAWEEVAEFDSLASYRNGSLFLRNDLLYYFCPLYLNAQSNDIFTISLK